MALPIDRLRKLFGAIDAFSGASICRYLKLAAKKLLPIYIYFIEQFAEQVEVVSGDDSKTRVLKMEEEARAGFRKKRESVDSMVAELEEKLGRVFPRKDGHGHKSQINVSHLHGLTDRHNPHSIIYLFRTHFGDLYGDEWFPFQVIFGLSDPDKDYEGGELVLTKLRPRLQTIPYVHG